MTSAIASADGWKYFRRFSGFLCRDFAMSIGRLAPASPRWVNPECRYSCRSQPVPGTPPTAVCTSSRARACPYDAGVIVAEGYQQLLEHDFAGVADATAATVAQFTRNADGAWELHEMIRGYDSDPVLFTAEMGRLSR